MGEMAIIEPTDITHDDRASWARSIAGAWQKSVEAIFETGRLIAQAKNALPHGEFGTMIETDLPFSASTAQRLMAISADPKLSDPAHVQHLPASWGTLYELTKLDEETFKRRVGEGTIRPDMIRRDVATGGARSIMASREQAGASLDFFPTPPWATRTLVEVVLPHLGVTLDGMTVHDPACGEGHMTGVFLEYEKIGAVVGSDIKDYGRDGRIVPAFQSVEDFLAPSAGIDPDWIVTNPPFGEKTLEFVLRALDVAGAGVAMFVRQQWLEGVDRYDQLFCDRPPTLYAQYVERVNLCEGKWDPYGSTATAYCWLVWVKDRAPQAPFWIPPGQRKRFMFADDIERFTAHPVLAPQGADELMGEVLALAEKPITMARNTYTAGLSEPTDGRYRRTPEGQPKVPDFVAPGSVIRTNYDTGPYIVTKVSGPYEYRPDDGDGHAYEHYSLTMVHSSKFRERPAKATLKGDSYINELVAVDGRLLKLFEANTDEVTVERFNPDAAELMGASRMAPSSGRPSVTDGELVEYKALHAIACGIKVAGSAIDELFQNGLADRDENQIWLTPAGMARGQLLSEKVKAATSPDDPDAIRVVNSDGQADAEAYAIALKANAERFGRHDKASAEPLLKLGRAAGVSPYQIAQDIGHPSGTIKTWLNRLGLTDINRMHAVNAQRAQEWSGHE